MIKYPMTVINRLTRNSCYMLCLAKTAEILTDEEVTHQNVLHLAMFSPNIADNGYVKDAEKWLKEIKPRLTGKWNIHEET